MIAKSELGDIIIPAHVLKKIKKEVDGQGAGLLRVTSLAPILTPRGRLLLEPLDDAPVLPSDLSHRLQEAFARGSGHGLLQLGAAEVGTALPPAFGYWREIAARYVSAVCGQQDLDEGRTHTPIPAPPPGELEMLAAAVPPMLGAEYLTGPVLEALWNALGTAFRNELAESKASVQEFLRRKSPAWNLVGRVHFNLAENRNDDEAPFVLVHKFLCRGTVEERIDQLIETKRQLSQDLLEGGAEVALTEMKDEELLKLVALDLRAASQG